MGFPGSCHSILAWPWTESTVTMSDKKSCGVKLTYGQLSATANFIWFRRTFCLRRRSTSKISGSLLAILCFDRQGQSHEHARCKHISRAGNFAYEKFAHRATESRTRNHPRAISRTWKRTHITAPERIFRVRYRARYPAHGKRALEPMRCLTLPRANSKVIYSETLLILDLWGIQCVSKGTDCDDLPSV